MRRSLVALAAACLAAGAVPAPAAAGKKAKPKPAKYAESGSVAIGHAGDVADGRNVTRTLFLQSCAVPPTQGTDGYVVALPDEMAGVAANVSVTGADAAGLYDLDLAFFDDDCAPAGSIATDAVDELGPMPAGTRYVLVTAFMGVETQFDFKATEARS